MKQPPHTLEQIKEKLNYNPETGDLVWKQLRNSKRIGQKANCLDLSGYVQINISGYVYKGHRIAWAIYYGKWPDGIIDHINGQRNDNRIQNLRECDHQTNCQNMRNGSCKNVTGYIGVHVSERSSKEKKYRAKIHLNGKQIHLGGYPTPELAHQAYVEEKRKLHAGCSI
jgi:uncharacterized protein YeaC (DUF1315 family)